MNYQEVWRRLAQTYGEGEAKAIARMVYEVRYGLTLSDLLMGRDEGVPPEELEAIVGRLERQEPVQYVLGQTTFCGRPFIVNEHVLIPRPETEELCQWIGECEALRANSEGPEGRGEALRILDVGTGSGCIAITLAATMAAAEVTAWDISEQTLQVARENAKCTHVHVSFEQVDALNPHSTATYDLIVSNPPYICRKEASAMEPNVLNYEPHGALFVPDDDALLFYRAIARYAVAALTAGGWLYFEINPLYASQMQGMLQAMGFKEIEIREDQFGKQRMMRARR